jgi:hypothetical protein
MWISIGSLITTVFFGILAIYFYFRSIHRPVPAYSVHPLRVKIVDNTRLTAPGLEVLHSGQSLGDQNVTAATLYFWNHGRGPIRKSDVLTPFTVDLNESAQVLDCQIVNSTGAVCGFGVSPDKSSKRVLISFDIVEHTDAVGIQIIFTGDANTAIQVNGACVGARMPKRVDLTEP